jgi:hypothetical protein
MSDMEAELAAMRAERDDAHAALGAIMRAIMREQETADEKSARIHARHVAEGRESSWCNLCVAEDRDAGPIDDSLFHSLWTKAGRAPDYDKRAWLALEKIVHAGLRRNDAQQTSSMIQKGLNEVNAVDITADISDALIAASWLDGPVTEAELPAVRVQLAQLLTETRAFERRRIEQAGASSSTPNASATMAARVAGWVCPQGCGRPREEHAVGRTQTNFLLLTCPSTPRPCEEPVRGTPAITGTDAWDALQRAAEDHAKGYDGPGTAPDAEARLRAAAVAYASADSSGVPSDELRIRECFTRATAILTQRMLVAELIRDVRRETVEACREALLAEAREEVPDAMNHESIWVRTRNARIRLSSLFTRPDPNGGT